VNKIDPFYIATRVHFAQLISRHGVPLTILNLIKARTATRVHMCVGVCVLTAAGLRSKRRRRHARPSSASSLRRPSTL
jgi:hypothetical protein